MKFSKCNIVISFLFLVSTVSGNDNKAAIGFPEKEEDPNLVNKDNRQPVYLPAKCAVDELYYPGDQKDDWICDCRPAYLFHPDSNKCWPALRQGPCSEGQHLILRANSAIPACVPNPCEKDGLVTYEGKCYRLGTPCGNSRWPHSSGLAVSAVDLSIRCEMLTVASRFSETDEPVSRTTASCPPGCKRSINGKCIPDPLQ